MRRLAFHVDMRNLVTASLVNNQHETDGTNSSDVFPVIVACFLDQPGNLARNLDGII